MPGKIDVYGWKGVNTTKNPIQLDNGEFTKAQNAFRDIVGENGGLHKRPGLTKVNSVALSGSVNGFINVPLNLISERKFFVGIDQGVTATHQWVVSTDQFGATSTSTSPAAVRTPGGNGELTGSGDRAWAYLSSKGIQSESLLIYPGASVQGDPIPIRAWDGTQEYELFKIPENPMAVANMTAAQLTNSIGAVRQMLLDGSDLYICVLDAYNSGATFDAFSRILHYSFETGALQQIGQGADGIASNGIGDGGVWFTCIELHAGFLYAGVGSNDGTNSTDAGIYRIRPGVDTTWTIDYTGATNEVPVCLKSYKGLLYAGFTDYDAGVAPLKVRSATGSWSNSTTIGTAGQTDSAWTTLTVFGDNLYATSRDIQGSPNNVSRVHKFDGSSWSVVKTIETAADPKTGVATVVHNDRLYVLAKSIAKDGLVTHTPDGSSWTDQDSNLTSSDVTCVFGVLAT